MIKPRLSATQIEDYRRCKRRWAWCYLDGVPKAESPYLEAGKRVHSALEAWLAKGVPPDRKTPHGAIALTGIKHLPAPGEAVIEEKWTWAPVGEPFTLIGFIDWYVPPGECAKRLLFGDHKTTSDFKWAKTAEELARDNTQALLYARWLLEKFPQIETLDGRWVYYRRNKPYGSRKVEFSIPAYAIEEPWQELVADARAMAEHKGRGARALELPFNAEACADYGGCPHIDRCQLTNQQRMASIMQHMSLKEKLQQVKAAQAQPPQQAQQAQPPQQAQQAQPQQAQPQQAQQAQQPPPPSQGVSQAAAMAIAQAQQSQPVSVVASAGAPTPPTAATPSPAVAPAAIGAQPAATPPGSVVVVPKRYPGQPPPGVVHTDAQGTSFAQPPPAAVQAAPETPPPPEQAPLPPQSEAAPQPAINPPESIFTMAPEDRPPHVTQGVLELAAKMKARGLCVGATPVTRTVPGEATGGTVAAPPAPSPTAPGVHVNPNPVTPKPMPPGPRPAPSSASAAVGTDNTVRASSRAPGHSIEWLFVDCVALKGGNGMQVCDLAHLQGLAAQSGDPDVCNYLDGGHAPGELGVTLSMRTPEGGALFERLAQRARFVVRGF